jgi:hypothetical protein
MGHARIALAMVGTSLTTMVGGASFAHAATGTFNYTGTFGDKYVIEKPESTHCCKPKDRAMI